MEKGKGFLVGALPALTSVEPGHSHRASPKGELDKQSGRWTVRVGQLIRRNRRAPKGHPEERGGE